jgi:hypothetical protein
MKRADLLDQLKEIIYGDELYHGTTLCQNGTLQIFWSPFEWRSPNDGLIAQPESWLCLGQSTWWANPEMKKIYFDLLDICLVSYPAYPGEHDYYDDRPSHPASAPAVRA